MSIPPPPNPPGTVSRDGHYVWDGYRWVPRYQRNSYAPYVGGGGVVLALILIGIGVWYFGYYDTARGKCDRGDLGACVVVAAEQAVASASASAVAASASASAQASSDAAAQQAYQNTIDQLNSEMASGCTVVPTQDQYNNVRVTYIGTNARANCQNATNTGQWMTASRVPGSSIVCFNSVLVIEDTGGRVLGTDMCNQLQLPIQPSS